MQVAIRPTSYADIRVPDATVVLEGQVLTRTGALYSSLTAPGTAGAAAPQGVSLQDLPAKVVFNPSLANGAPVNPQRVLACANKGYLAIRVQDATEYASLTVGAFFGLSLGNAVNVGTGGTLAASMTTSGNTPVVAGKQIGSDGNFYIFTEI